MSFLNFIDFVISSHTFVSRSSESRSRPSEIKRKTGRESTCYKTLVNQAQLYKYDFRGMTGNSSLDVRRDAVQRFLTNVESIPKMRTAAGDNNA